MDEAQEQRDARRLSEARAQWIKETELIKMNGPWVDCDRHCEALRYPKTEAEVRAALVHWEGHGYAYGCSHGC